MKITVNGQEQELAGAPTVLELLGRLGLTPEHVAVERNRDIVPRATFAAATLADGDRLEIVTFVGGG